MVINHKLNANFFLKSISICDCNNAVAIVKLLVMVKCCRKRVFADANILRRHILPTQKLFATLLITSPLLPSQILFATANEVFATVYC